jgi:hypothetical protein
VQDHIQIAPLIEAISAGRVYEVERWIADGHPLQFVYPADRRKSPVSPLQAAVRTGQHDVVLLLLCNGYRTELERFSPFSEALRDDRSDLVYLLVDWGADRSAIDPHTVVSSYDAALVERIWRLGVDLSEDDALAGAVAFSASNKPLYGFLKRHAHEDPILQDQLNRGLYLAVDHARSDDDHERAVHLCIWAGADPWARVRDPYEDEKEGDDDWSVYRCAAGCAILGGHAGLLAAMKLKADSPHFQRLYDATLDPKCYDVLFRICPPRDTNRIANHALLYLDSGLDDLRWKASALLERLFATGGRLERIEERACRSAQKYIREHVAFSGRSLVQLLQDPAHADLSAFLQIIHSPRIVELHREFRISRQSLERLLARATTKSSVVAAVRKALRPKPRRRWAP